MTLFRARIPIRYPEDNTVNGQSDEEGNLPLMSGSMWEIDVDLDTGKIVDWPEGNTAKIYTKVVDSGMYYLIEEGEEIFSLEEEYVPDCLQLDDNGYGDYVVITIEPDGKIVNWPSRDDVFGCFDNEH